MCLPTWSVAFSLGLVYFPCCVSEEGDCSIVDGKRMVVGVL